MPEITLQQYQQKLEMLLQERRNDEVVQHCRHILQYYPKNVMVYRFMGMALIETARYPEAGDVFQRVLGVYPDDYQAHVGLSRVAQHDRKGEEAIWHLERAFEQDPNNAPLLENLRDLYRQYRGVEQTRFQLTARAVAVQQIRNGLYTQAIDTLQKALNQMPNRLDLRLLLAQVLWENHYTLIAGETALEVLRQIPDCLEANRIMTQLWLKEQRPSDAQRYLSRIEAVDPFIAFEVAQGALPPANAFHLIELDYQREASRQMVSDNPDWLSSLEREAPLAGEAAPAAASDEDWMNLMFEEDAPPTEDTDAVLALDFDSETLEDVGLDDEVDWLQELEGATSDQTRTVQLEAENPIDDPLASLFGDDDADWMQDAVPDNGANSGTNSGTKNTGLTGLLSSLGDRSTGLTGLLNALEEDPDEGQEDAQAEDDWMRALNKPTAPLQDPNALKPTSTLPGAPELDDEEDALSWLDAPQQVAPTGSLTDEDDPLAWMKQSGIEYLEDAPSSTYNPVMDEDDNRNFTEPNENNPLAWMQNAGVEMIEEERVQRWDESPVKTDDLPSNDADPLAWMRSAGIEFVEEEDEEDDDATPVTRNSYFSENEEDTVDWFSTEDQLDELLTLETMSEQGTGALTGTGSLAAEQDEDMADENDRIPDWLSSEDDDEQEEAGLEWLGSFEQKPSFDQKPSDVEDDEDALDWMVDELATEDEEAIPDWLTAASPAVSATLFQTDETEEDRQSLDWSAQVDEPADAPDWLSSVGSVEPTRVESGSLFDSEDEDEATPDWLSAVSPGNQPSAMQDGEFALDFALDDDDEDDDAISETTPEWLSAVSPGNQPSAMQDDEFTLDFALDDDEEAEDAISETTPDWLSAVSPGNQPSAMQDDEFSLDFALDDDEEDDAISETTPDWLSAVSPGNQPSAMQDDEFALDFAQDDEEDDDAISETTPDWLSAVSPGNQPSAMQDDEFSLDFAQDDDEEDDAISETTPDWLSAVYPGNQPSAMQDGEFALDFALDDDEEDDAISETTPDWLSAVSPGNQPSAMQDDDEEVFSLDFALDDEEDDAISETTPDWLSAVSFDNPEAVTDDEEDDFVPAMTSRNRPSAYETETDLYAEQEDEETLPGDTDVPDWLGAVNPSTAQSDESFDEDFEFEEESAGQSAAPSWLVEDDEADEAQPDWLSAIKNSSGEDRFEKEDEEPVADWLAAVDVEGEASDDEYELDFIGDEATYSSNVLDGNPYEALSEELAPTPATNAPDWLNAMVPGLDLDYDAQEEDEQDAFETVIADAPTATPARSGDFAWLTDIVEEELAPPASIPRPGAQPAAASPAPRRQVFSFSRAPAWLRRLRGESPAPSTPSTSGTPSLTGTPSPAGAAPALEDDDLPPWLEFDDDDQ